MAQKQCTLPSLSMILEHIKLISIYSFTYATHTKINRWIKTVEKSGLHCFDRFIKTLVKNKGYIANYFKARKNSGFVEGLNNKIKVAKRRCYGLFNPETIFQRLFLDLQGYEKFA